MSGRLRRFGELTVDSDFTTTALLALLFLALCLMLARDIRHTLSSSGNHFAIIGTLNRLGAAFALFYCLLFAFRWPDILVRIGCAFFAAHLSIEFALTYLRISPTGRPVLTFAALMLSQASIASILAAIARWFIRVVRWEPQSRGEREDR
jgi:hypothetical protein